MTEYFIWLLLDYFAMWYVVSCPHRSFLGMLVFMVPCASHPKSRRPRLRGRSNGRRSTQNAKSSP